MLRWRSLRRTRYVCENCVRGMNGSQVIAPASAIEEVSRAVRVETWQSWLLASKRENVVNTKVLAGFTRHIEMCRGEASIAADGKREARRRGVETR